jgi:hypothetical protein
VEVHKEDVLMFWLKNEALGIDEELWWYLDTEDLAQRFTLVLDLDSKD